jgi:hypothetical protein
MLIEPRPDQSQVFQGRIREDGLIKLGAARSRAPTAWRLVDIDIDIDIDKESSMFIYTLNRQKLRKAGRREGGWPSGTDWPRSGSWSCRFIGNFSYIRAARVHQGW